MSCIKKFQEVHNLCVFVNPGSFCTIKLIQVFQTCVIFPMEEDNKYTPLLISVGALCRKTYFLEYSISKSIQEFHQNYMQVIYEIIGSDLESTDLGSCKECENIIENVNLLLAIPYICCQFLQGV